MGSNLIHCVCVRFAHIGLGEQRCGKETNREKNSENDKEIKIDDEKVVRVKGQMFIFADVNHHIAIQLF